MVVIPKPKYCSEDWLDMKPVEGGRICGSCQKHIIDFTKMTWHEIATLQSLNGNTLCGVYTSKQLKYWGQEVPSNQQLLRQAVITGGLVSLLALPGQAQSSTPSDSLVLKGYVYDESTLEPMPFAQIEIRHRGLTCTADYDGMFQLPISKSFLETDSIHVSYVGYINQAGKITSYQHEIVQEDIQWPNADIYIPMRTNNMIAFYVEPPSRAKRIWRRITRVFR